ncbi:MAG TPA: polysaccharide deacetylase family protein [Bacillota bacterium]|nr:polysaccharide deacetylase family protein [Bacillota bacterium]
MFYFNRTWVWTMLCLSIFGLGYFAGFWTAGNIPVIGTFSKQMPIFYVKKSSSEVCLTFDISWGNETLPRVLKILEENQVPATFFCSGPWGIRNPDALKSIYNKGHEIASHGDRHINLSQYPKAVVEDNLIKAHRDLLTVVDKVAPYFRPPNGDYDDLVIDTAREVGFETVIWSVDSLDWKNPGPDYMIKRVVSKVFPGAILLFHASDSSKQIHLALPEIIKELRIKGLKPVTLSQLMSEGTPGRNDPR